MSALPVHQIESLEQQETEIIYLMIPPSASAAVALPKPYTIAERFGLLSERIQYASHRSGKHLLAAYFAVGMTAVVGYSLYTFKSALGINIFQTQRLESFVPLPGYGR